MTLNILKDLLEKHQSMENEIKELKKKKL
jgi:hypothetical protein